MAEPPAPLVHRAAVAHPWAGAPPVVAVLRAPHASMYAPVIDSVIRGGIRAVELTLTTPGTLAELPGLLERFDGTARLGVGTVIHGAQARAAIERGATYLVTPCVAHDVVSTAVDAGVAVYPGGLTPTELFAGWSAGATAVKIFPASSVTPSYLRDLHGPFPDLQAVPSGGVSIDNARDWLAAGAAAVSVGGPLLQDAFRGGDLDELRRRAERFCAVLDAP